MEEKANETHVTVALMATRMAELEKDKESLVDDIAYLKSQSMRNNLIFTGVQESGKIESPDQTETKLRRHLVGAMHMSADVAESIKFERVHRSPSEPIRGKTRSIVAISCWYYY